MIRKLKLIIMVDQNLIIDFRVMILIILIIPTIDDYVIDIVYD